MNKSKNEEENKIFSELDILNEKRDKCNNIFSNIKKYFINRKINYLETNKERIVQRKLKKEIEKITAVENKINYLQNNQSEELDFRTRRIINEINTKVTILNNLVPQIYGSVGELKAIEILKQLPNQYYIINDFRSTFNPPLFSKRENDRIYSTQIDHIIVGPTGIFVIETKYWKQKTIENNSLFSPIKQVKRGGFALFILLNDIIRNENPIEFSNHWGEYQISVSNILLMMNATTNENFQYVKILTENNIIKYITNKSAVLNDNQIHYIVKILKYWRNSA